MNPNKRPIWNRMFSRLKRAWCEEVIDCWVASDLKNSIRSPKFSESESLLITSSGRLEDYRQALGEHRYNVFNERSASSIGLILFVDGEYACSMWLTDQPQENEGTPPFTYRVAPNSGQIYVYDGFAVEKFRSRRHFYKLTQFAYNWCQERGYKEVVLNFDATQPRWLSFYERLGFKQVGLGKYTRWLCWERRDVAILDKLFTNG